MITSPIENTFAAGPKASGTANTSPSQPSTGVWTAAELANSSAFSAGRPATASASGAAGMTPPLATIAAALAKPPTAMIHTPGSRRLSHRNHASSP